MMLYKSIKYAGLKIVLKPIHTYRDRFGEPKIEEGLSIKFEKGLFRTDNEKIILFLTDYMKKHPNEIVAVNEEKMKRNAEIMKRATEMAKEEIAKAEKEEVLKMVKGKEKITVKEEEKE